MDTLVYISGRLKWKICNEISREESMYYKLVEILTKRPIENSGSLDHK